MTDSLRIGLDQCEDQVRLAQVNYALGRPEVMLLSAEPSSLESISAAVARFGLSMPDDEALVKYLQLKSQGPDDLRRKLYFELSQSLLESPDLFRFEYLDTGNKHQIGLVFRQERIAARIESLKCPPLTGVLSPAITLRSVALARAYLIFCKSEPGDLVALATINAELASVVLLYRQKIVSIGSCAITARAGQFKSVAIALKTLVNYKLTSIRDYGITVPLSVLLVTGDAVTADQRENLQAYFSARVTSFSPKQAVLEQAAKAGVADPEPYLVALGLTVN